MFQTMNIAKGVNVHVNETTQFKTINFSLKFKDKLTKKSVCTVDPGERPAAQQRSLPFSYSTSYGA
ncbi:hypothetical protein [Planococcus glaciei]|uniref:hypothetical protein n=1 Tax=Planococcus glaciei TaxID=459472 RepID=UPI003CCD2EFD